MFKLVQTRRGRETVFMVDSRKKCQDRMAQLRSSQRTGIRGDKVVYRIEPAEDTEKFRRAPDRNFDPSGSVRGGPKRVR